MNDIRFGLRQLRQAPAYAALVIVTMAIGIGATTTLFSVVDGVLLKPLPWPRAERLVRVTETRQGRAGRVVGTVSNATFLAWRDHHDTIEDLGGWLTQTATMTGQGDPVRISVVPATPSLFAILQARPLIGRLFVERDGARDQAGLVILSYGLWQERFGGRPETVGQIVQFDDKPYTIVGVMPREFAFPDRETRAWTAWSVPSVVAPNGMQVGVIFRAIARLRDGATFAQAAAEASSRARGAPDMGFAAKALFGATGPIEVSAVPELQALTADVRPAILILLSAVTLLLMAATANVAGIQLARSTTRRREIAVRAAIGAGQPRIIRQLVVENAVVALCGGAAGLVLAAALQKMLPMIVPTGFPRLDAVALDGRVLSFAISLSVLTSVVCGLLPAWETRRVNVVEVLSEDGAAPVAGGLRSPIARTRAAIMAGQVAIACMLLAGAALLTRSFVTLIRADRGYDPVNVLTARLPFPASYPLESRRQLLERLVDRLRVVPGVTHAAYGTALPFVSFGGFTAFTMRSPLNPGVELSVQAAQRVVSPDYFAAMRLRLIAGRTLTNDDTPTTPPVVVVNRTFARQYLGDRAVGSRIPQRGPRAGGIRFADDHADWEVIGEVDDMRQDVASPLQPEIFASIKQITTQTTNLSFDPILVIRTSANPTAYVPTLRALVHEQAPALALDSVMAMEDRVMTSLARPRLYAIILTWFGGFALLLVGVGLFGAVSFTVAQRSREIGVRSALGARAGHIVRLVLGQAIWIVAIGVVIGLAATLASARTLSAFLYGVSPYDMPTLTAVVVAIVAVVAIACIVPAYRAATMDPLEALRR